MPSPATSPPHALRRPTCILPHQAARKGIPAPRVVTPAVFLLLLIPEIIPAQQPGRPPEPPPPRVLEATVTIGSEYTDNFFRSQSAVQSNFRQTVTPDLTLKLSGALHRTDLRYRPTVAYSTLLEEIAHFHALEAEGSYDLTPFLTLHATEFFSRSDTPSVTDPNTLLIGRTITNQNRLTLELPYRADTWSLTPRTSWQFTANESQTREADERSNILTFGVDGLVTLMPWNTTLRGNVEAVSAQFRLSEDFSGETYRAGLSRSFGPLFDLTLDGSLSWRRPSRSQDFTITDVLLGGRYQPWETLTLSAGVGYQQTDVTEQAGTQGVTYTSQASYTGGVFSLVAASDLAIQETFTQTQNVGLVRSLNFQLQLTYPATEGLTLTGIGKWGRNEFLQSGTDRKETVWSWILSVSFQLTRTLRLNGAWERTQRDSTVTAQEFSANTFRIDLIVDLR